MTAKSLYQRLASLRSLRLIQIHSDKAGDLIACTLHQFDEHDIPEYRALSYVWGNPVPAHQILMNGIPCHIHENFGYFIDQAWKDANQCAKQSPDGLPIINHWTDALCLNQSDPAEISQHVARMGDIYSVAEQVIIWLGGGAMEPKIARGSSSTRR
jgi:hypothetical protein